MPIKLNDTAKALLKTGNAETIRVIRETDSLPMHKCPNCHDTGAIWIQELQGPIGYPSFANVLVTFLGNDCYKIVGNYTYPCPACGDHVRRMSYLWEQSGLLENEHGWKVDYIKGQKGKEEALRIGLDLIAMTPFPRGLYLFYGNYGAGKTGMLKALTAQFTLAGVPARYIRAADILIELRAIYDKTTDLKETELLQAYGGYTFLAIDEIDVFNQTTWSENTIRTLLDTRYARRGSSATAIASNKDPMNLWPYMASRWEEGARVLIGGASLRKSKPETWYEREN